MHAHSKSKFRITTAIFVQNFVYHWATTTPTIAFAASLREEERRSSCRLSSLLVSYIDGGLPSWETSKPDTSALRCADIRFRDCWWCLARVSIILGAAPGLSAAAVLAAAVLGAAPSSRSPSHSSFSISAVVFRRPTTCSGLLVFHNPLNFSCASSQSLLRQTYYSTRE